MFASLAAAMAGERAPWIVGTYAYPGRDRAAAIRPLGTYLSRRGGHPVQVRLFASPSALVEAMREGEVDVAVPNLHGFLQARRWPGKIVPLPVPEVPPAQADRYRAVLVARDGVPALDALRQVADRMRLVMVGRDSASGGFIPAAELREHGLEVEGSFASLAYAGSHAAALQAVVSGEADVAALAADVHASADEAGLQVLWRSDPIPPGPLLCRKAEGVPCEAIAAWLLEAHERDGEVMAGLRAGWPEFGDATTFREPDLGTLDALPDEI